MRYGLTILPELPWDRARHQWQEAEELGFHHAWTYDHLVWSGLPDSPWYGAVPTLTAAAGVTSRIGLGTFVSSPNYHHPYPFLRDLRAVDDISGHRLLCAVGTGGNLDAEILGESLTLKQRVDRFHEFVPLLHRLLREDHVDSTGDWFSTVDARTLPLAEPFPLLVAANGPRSLTLAAAYGDGWVTTGPKTEDEDTWWSTVGDLARRLDDLEAASGRRIDRYLSIDASPRFALESVAVFEELAGRAEGLGFTDVVTHYPRPEGPYAGDPAVLGRLSLGSR